MVNLELTTPPLAGGQSFTRTVTDTLAFSDAVSGAFAFTRSPSDTLVLQDVPASQIAGRHDVTDTLVLASPLSNVGTYTRSFADTLVFRDFQFMAWARTIADTLGLIRDTVIPESFNQIVGSGVDILLLVGRRTWVSKNLFWDFYTPAGGTTNFKTSSDGAVWSAATDLAVQTLATWYDRKRNNLWLLNRPTTTSISVQLYTPKSDGSLPTSGSATTFVPLYRVNNGSIMSAGPNSLWVTLDSINGVDNHYHVETWYFNGKTWSNVDDFDSGQTANEYGGAVIVTKSGVVNVIVAATGVGDKVRFKYSSNNGGSWTEVDSANANYTQDDLGLGVGSSGLEGDIIYVSVENAATTFGWFMSFAFGAAAVANEAQIFGARTDKQSVFGDGNTVVIIFSGAESTDHKLYYDISTNGGSSFAGATTLLTDAVNFPTFPAISADQGDTRSGFQLFGDYRGELSGAYNSTGFVLNIGVDNITGILNLFQPADTLVFSDTTQGTKFATLMRTIIDTLIFSDLLTRTATYTRSPSDTFVFQDPAQRTQGYLRSNADALILQDLTSQTQSWNRSTADTLVLRDLLSRTQGWARSNSDTLIFNDFSQIVTGQAFLRTIIDTLVLADLISRVQGWSRNNSDTIILADVTTKIQGWMRSLNDTLVFQDVISRAQGWARAITDTLVLADVLSMAQGWNRSLADTLVLADLSSRTFTASRTNADTLVLMDLTTNMQGWIRSPADTLVFRDFVQQSQGWSRSLADTLVLNDSLLRSQSWVRSLADTLVFTDLVTATLVTGMTRLIFDTLTIGDAVTRTSSFIRTSAETIQLSDTVSFTKIIIKTPHGKITKYITLRKRMARHEPEDFDVVTN